MEDKKIEITELEYIQLKERCECNYNAYVKADEELSRLKDCRYCYNTVEGQDWTENGVCRKCCHKNNFIPIIAEEVL